MGRLFDHLKLRDPLKKKTYAANFCYSPQIGFSKMFLVSFIAKMPRCC